MPSFNDPFRNKDLAIIVGKDEITDKQYFLLFPTTFSTKSRINFVILPILNLLLVNVFNLVKSKKLSFGKRLTL